MTAESIAKALGGRTAAACVRAALSHQPTRAEALFLDPDEGGIPDQAALDWLTGQGVTMGAITSPWAIAAAHVRFDGRGRYAPHPLGDLAFILPVIDRDGAADLCAWIPRTGATATRLGVGTMLGGGLIGRSTGDGVTIPPLRVFLSPLDWLRHRRRGVVFLDPPRAAAALAGVVITAIDNQHAADLRRALRVPAPIVRVRNLERIAA
jgi:hypothetical protein